MKAIKQETLSKEVVIANQKTETPKETYEIKITEILEKVVSIEATCQDEAFEIVEDRYNTEVYVLDASDFTEVKFEVA